MRGILFKENGTILHRTRQLCHVIPMDHGWMEQDPMELRNGLKNLVIQSVNFMCSINETIDVVAVTSLRSSLVPVDKKGNPLYNVITWQDKRTIPICQDMKDYFGEIFKFSGSHVNPVYSAPKMKWLRENKPEIYEKAYKLTVVPEYLIHYMAGKFYTDYTYASRSHLMNIEKFEWDQRLLELFNVDKEKLCEIKAPGEIVGFTSKSFEEETGLAKDTPLISSGGDQQCGMIGQGVSFPGEVSLTVGTGAYLLTSSRKVPKNLNWDVVCNASADAGNYILESNVLTCTSAMEWFRKNFYFEAQDFYEKLNDILDKVPAGSHGSLALPYFQGRSTPDWNSRACALFYGISLGTTREDMLKALLESICMEIRNNILTFKKYLPIDEVLVDGGLSKCDAFNKMQADIYGMPLICMNNTESTAFGALMIASRTMGIYKDLDEAFSIIRHDDLTNAKKYEAHRENHEFYEKLRKKMNDIYSNMTNIWAE